jgi:hypothetical protein
MGIFDSGIVFFGYKRYPMPDGGVINVSLPNINVRFKPEK